MDPPVLAALLPFSSQGRLRAGGESVYLALPLVFPFPSLRFRTMDVTTTVSLADRAASLRQSDIRAVTQRVKEVGGINLGQGVCDLPTPQPIKDRAHRARSLIG